MISIVFISIGPGYAVDKNMDADQELYRKIILFSDALTLVQTDYVDEVSPEKLVYGALRGMVGGLDEYSEFMDPDDYREMQVETKGEFGGLGVVISMRDDVLTVIAPIDGTPADEAGVKAGDKIVKIDDEITKGFGLRDAVKKLRGKPKTKVKLTIFREGEDELIDFTITRSIIKLKSIKKSEILKDGIAYIKLIEFTEKASREIESNLVSLKKKGMKALILDLRNNPGGLLDASHEVADKFLKKGTIIVSIKGRSPKQNKIFRARNKKKFLDFPMVVLVNKGSASASEIVAGAIQDNKRGIILGTKTFGKGSVQTIIPLKDGSAVRLTTAAYYTPSGRSIKDEGIMPDIEIELDEEEDAEEDVFDKVEEKKPEELPYDNQLQAAIDTLRGILIYGKNG